MSFLLIVAFVTVIIIICTFNAAKWVGRRFAGFMVNERMVMSDTGQFHWTGPSAGLRYPDKILAANGKAITNPGDLEEVVDSVELHEPIRYSVDKGGRIVEIAIPTTLFTLNDFIVIFGIQLLCGITYILIGSIVFMMKPDSEVSWAFFLSYFFCSIYSTISFDTASTHSTAMRMIYMTAMAYVPAGFVHLSLVFPDRRKAVQERSWLQLVPYLVATAIAVPFVILYPKPAFLIAYNLVFMYMVAAAVFLLVSSLLSYYRGASAIARQRARVVLFGAAVALPLPAVALFAPFLKTFVPFLANLSGGLAVQNNFFAIPAVIFPMSIAYAIVRHNLFDVDLYIKRAVGYGVMTAFVGAAYFSVQVVLRTVILKPVFGDRAEAVYPVLFALLVVFLFNPVRNRVQKVVDRIFYRLEYDYQETVKRVSETMRSMLSLEEIVANTINTALQTMFIDSGCVMLLNRQKQVYECQLMRGEKEAHAGAAPVSDVPIQMIAIADKADVSQDWTGPGEAPRYGGAEPGKAAGLVELGRVEESKEANGKAIVLPADSPLIRKVAERAGEVTIYDVMEDPLFEEEREACRGVFERTGSTLVVPLLYKDRVSGLLFVGNKKSGKFYNRDDVNLLRTLADQGAVAIENARLLDEVIEKERMEEELAIARDLQISMLPETCPSIEQFKIAALSTPAREVGGDFFDFIEMGRDRLGFLIGDVTGKSVSGALVMSSARSVFRMLSEQELTVADIMNRANRRIKRDVKKGMFVALLYAVIEAGTRTLRLTSAGQPQPIYLRAETGEATLVETEGDTFPLGILEDADYSETRLQLAPGDRVIFYTDGIVEAMNPRNEIFGFERLLEVVQKAKAYSADLLLREIVEQVETFAEGAPQHDDLTLIVLGVEE